MSGYFSLPKPFEALCDYEESDSESDPESTHTSEVKSGAEIKVQSVLNGDFKPTANSDYAENATSEARKEELSDSSDSDESDDDDKPGKKSSSAGSNSVSVNNATSRLGESGFDKKAFFKLRSKEFESSSKICALPKSASEIREKMRQLEMMKNSARKLNHAAVVEEDRVNKLPANWQALQKKNDWMLYEDERKKECKEDGKEWDRVKLLSVQADEAERLLSRKRKKNPDTGFASFEQASYRQYNRLTRQMTVDRGEYETHKEEVGQESQHVDSMYHGTHKPSEAAVERMVTDLDKQIAKRAKFSRRRTFIEDRDIDYINERNAKFNKKIERFYGEYTAEIKQNLERGTAI